MGWVTRNNCRYYYLARRVHGRPHRIYLGSGPAAEQAAHEVEQRKRQRADERAQLQVDRQLHDDALQPFLDLADQTDSLFRATLEAHGYHQHARGPWRKRKAQRGALPAATPDASPPPSRPLDQQETRP